MNGLRRETLAVPVAAAGERLDHWLVDVFGGVSRKAVKKALDSGQVFVDGRCERRANYRLNGGEIVLATVAAPPLPVAAPPLAFLYRDAHLLAIDKPPGLPAHPTVAGRVNALDLVAARLRGEGHPTPPILLHRLDADTSGVLLFALTSAANRDLYRQFVDHRVVKIYYALVSGQPPQQFAIRNHLKAGVHGKTVAVSSGGQPAETTFRTLRQGAGMALVEAAPKTGRTHQIRVHLAGAGHPLLGDILYGGSATLRIGDEPRAVPRHLLHATTLIVTHPQSGETLSLSAPLPADFTTLLATFPA